MGATVEAELSKDQKAGVIIKHDDEKYVVAWRFKKKLKPFVGITDVKLVGDEWLDTGGNAWPADAVASVAAAIADIANGRAAPPLADPLHVELQQREEDAPAGKTWVIAIDKKSVLVVYPFEYDGTPSIMIRNYEKQGEWNYTCYDIQSIAVATQIADYVMKTR
jgi:hypothetical protein